MTTKKEADKISFFTKIFKNAVGLLLFTGIYYFSFVFQPVPNISYQPDIGGNSIIGPGPDGDIEICYITYNNVCPSNWKSELIYGKLVVILPKKLVVDGTYPRIGFAFSYSPSVFSEEEINEITDRFIQQLDLEEAPYVVKFDVFLNVQGRPDIEGFILQNENSYVGYRYIDPGDLTVWNITLSKYESYFLKFQISDIEFVYGKNDDLYRYCCREESIVGPSVSVAMDYTLSYKISNLVENIWDDFKNDRGNWWIVKSVFGYLVVLTGWTLVRKNKSYTKE